MNWRSVREPPGRIDPSSRKEFVTDQVLFPGVSAAENFSTRESTNESARSSWAGCRNLPRRSNRHRNRLVFLESKKSPQKTKPSPTVKQSTSYKSKLEHVVRAFCGGAQQHVLRHSARASNTETAGRGPSDRIAPWPGVVSSPTRSRRATRACIAQSQASHLHSNASMKHWWQRP